MPSPLIRPPEPIDQSALQRQGLVSLEREAYWCSRVELQYEAALVRAMRHCLDQPSPLVFSPEWLTEKKQEFISGEKGRLDSVELSEQFDAVFGMLDRGHSLSAITGPPGAAKSTVASLWTRVARARYPDLPLVLVTQERPALHRLKDKINATGAHVLTVEEALSLHTAWPENAAIIIDEAGLFCTQILSDLMGRAIQNSAAKIILIGDDKQLEPVQPGQPFRWLCQQPRIDIVKLSHPFRQKNLELRKAVAHLYQGEIEQALSCIPCHFITPSFFMKTLRTEINNSAPDKCFVIVHGSDYVMERLKILCPVFRIFSLTAAQGLAIDRVILVVAGEINCAEMLVGCSRQRFALDVFVDQGVYTDAEHLVQQVSSQPQSLMALDVIEPDTVLKILDQAEVVG